MDTYYINFQLILFVSFIFKKIIVSILYAAFVIRIGHRTSAERHIYKFLSVKVPRSKNALPVVTLYSRRICAL